MDVFIPRRTLPVGGGTHCSALPIISGATMAEGIPVCPLEAAQDDDLENDWPTLKQVTRRRVEATFCVLNA